MPKLILFDEFHLSLLIPAQLDPTAVRRIRRTVNGRQLQGRLRQAVRATLRSYPELVAVHLRLSR